MFVDQETIGEVKRALLSIPQVSSVEVGEFRTHDGGVGLSVCSVVDGGDKVDRFLVYEVEADLIQRLPGILFEFSTRAFSIDDSCPQTWTNTNQEGTWTSTDWKVS